jgi:hypothetical protein
MELNKDMKEFRKVTFNKIADNNVRIAELKLSIEKDKTALKSVHQKQIIKTVAGQKRY